MNKDLPVILYNFEEINLDLNHNDNYIIVTDFEFDNINLNVVRDSKCNVLLFSKMKSSVNLNVVINENANLKLDVISMNNETSDHYNFDLVGEYATLDMNVLSLTKNAKKEFKYFVNHLAPETKSSVSNYGISFENGINNFKVNGIIKPNMKNSDVRQLTKGLILHPTGECLAEPILLIDYYDVKAYHGATIGKISDDDLFYLMSRGLTKDEAFMLIINGILNPFVKDLNDEMIKEEVMGAYFAYF
jgi:Fe-S cluster assembly protein SufD